MRNSYINKREFFDLPGGGLRFFENSTRGLVREVLEETGISIRLLKPFNVYDVIRPFVHMTIITYLCICDTSKVILSGEHDGYMWIGKNEVENSPVPIWMKRIFKEAFAEFEK